MTPGSAQKSTSQLLQTEWGKSVRIARGTRSQTWLGRRVGVDQTVISRIERGTYKLSLDLMIGLAAALEEELEVLFRFPPGLMEIERYRRGSGPLAKAAS